MFTGECGVPVLDAPGGSAQLQHPDPHDSAMPASATDLCPRSPHETRRLRANEELQGDSACESAFD